MVKRYHHTKLELIGCLGSKQTADPLYSLKGPWDPHPLTILAPLTKRACICLWMSRWVKPYHHTKLELIGCLGYKETTGPL